VVHDDGSRAEGPDKKMLRGEKRRNWLVIGLISALLATGFISKGPSAGKLKKDIPGWQVIRPPHEVSALAIQGDLVWAGGTDGVYGLDLISGQVVKKLDGQAPLSYVKALLVDKSGMLWVGHQGGLTCYDGSNSRTFTREDGLPDNRVNALLQDREGRLWAGTWGGAAVREGESWRVITASDGLADNMVNVMLQDQQGGLWFGSYVAPRGGISLWLNGQWQYFSTANGLPHNNLSALYLDQSGLVWAGTGLYEYGGACQLVPGQSGWTIERTFTGGDGLAGEKVRSIFQDRDGMFWFGSEYDGLARWSGNGWRIFTGSDGLSNPEIKAILQDAEGNLWLGTRDGITRVSAEALKALALSK